MTAIAPPHPSSTAASTAMSAGAGAASRGSRPAAQNRVQVQVGLHEERPFPGAVAYQAMAVLAMTRTYHYPQHERTPGPNLTKRGCVLVLTEAPRQELAAATRMRLLETISPLLALGRVGAQLALELMQKEEVQDGHQVLLWSDGEHARLLSQGDHRIIHIHGSSASLIRPPVPHGIGHHEMDLHPGDVLVIVAHATHAQLSLPTLAAMAREEHTPQGLCLHATRLAAAKDTMSHHAALALTVVTEGDPSGWKKVLPAS